MMHSRPVLVWFRDDLRLTDNLALFAAAADGPLVAAYVLDENPAEMRPLGGAAKWWLARSLDALRRDLERYGVPLILRRGPAAREILKLAEQLGAGSVHWNRRYDPEGIATDTGIKAALKQAGVQATSHEGHLLREPWDVTTQSGTPLKVFTPFWRAHGAKGEPRAPLPRPAAMTAAEISIASDDINTWGLNPSPYWAKGFEPMWTPGEAGAEARLSAFLDAGLEDYAEDRNRPDLASTSRLSPHLRFGEITPARIWVAAQMKAETTGQKGLGKFLSEIGWREFAYHLLFHQPNLRTENFSPRFDAFPWRDDDKALKAWQQGLTGYPIVDAGMRELWTTGWMHNRVRMVTASFLIKHLLIHWRRGEEWFWDTLVDADHANNAASWQWVAGSGADAAPYYRIFNPVIQGEKFDPNGDYVRRFVPELSRMPKAYIHQPWAAPPSILAASGVTLGLTYPHPIVDHAKARDRALAAFAAIKAVDAA
jgi:deoxyribodipyrimidine photo-lyase